MIGFVSYFSSDGMSPASHKSCRLSSFKPSNDRAKSAKSLKDKSKKSNIRRIPRILNKGKVCIRVATSLVRLVGSAREDKARCCLSSNFEKGAQARARLGFGKKFLKLASLNFRDSS